MNGKVVYGTVSADLYLEELTKITQTAYVSWDWNAIYGCCRFVIWGNESRAVS
jgi:hypothetical protein